MDGKVHAERSRSTTKPETQQGISGVEGYTAIAVSLGLVAKALFVAVLFHPLLALVFVDFRFTTFLNGAHGVLLSGLGLAGNVITGPAC